MRLCGAISKLLVFGVFFSLGLGTQEQVEPILVYTKVISECGDLPDVIGDTVKVVGPIICPKKTTVTIASNHAFNSFTYGDSPGVQFHNVQFLVPTGSTVFFGAPVLNFGRDEGSDWEIFVVDGSLILFADGKDSTTLDGSPDDKHGLIKINPGGSFRPEGAMAYTENGIRVVFGTETPEDFDPNATAPSKATSGPDSISNRSPAPVEPSCQGVDTTPASMPTPVPELRRVDNLSRSPADDASLTSDSSMVPSHAGDRLADPANDLPKDKDIVFLEPATYIKPETEQDSELGRRKKLRKIDFEHDVQVKERQLRLKVGQKLVSPAALIGRHPGTLSVGVHGSVMHKTPAAGDGYHARIKEYILQEQCPRCPWDTNIEGTDIAVAMMALTGKSDVAVQLVRLLRPKKNELKKVLRRREKKLDRIKRERQKLRKKQLEQDKVAPTEQQILDEDRADLVKWIEEHTASLRVTDRGVVEVFLDGVKVISESGGMYEGQQVAKAKWVRNAAKLFTRERRKSDRYVLHVVHDGMEVKLGGEVVWARRSHDVGAISESDRNYEEQQQEEEDTWLGNLPELLARNNENSNMHQLHPVPGGFEIRLGSEVVWAHRIR